MSTNYGRIWEKHNAMTIPKGYHIHHIDGNHENNDPANLKCVSAQEHFEIHLKQGDIVAKYGKFIQGADRAGKLGGAKNKGKVRSDLYKDQLSVGMRASYVRRDGSPLKNRSISETHKQRISDANQGENNPMFGKTHSDETRQKIKENRGSLASENNPMFGKTHSDETRQKIKEKAIGRKSKMKGRINLTTRARNRKWYTNGVIEILLTADTQPPDFILGRIKCKK